MVVVAVLAAGAVTAGRAGTTAAAGAKPTASVMLMSSSPESSLESKDAREALLLFGLEGRRGGLAAVRSGIASTGEVACVPRSSPSAPRGVGTVLIPADRRSVPSEPEPLVGEGGGLLADGGSEERVGSLACGAWGGRVVDRTGTRADRAADSGLSGYVPSFMVSPPSRIVAPLDVWLVPRRLRKEE